MRMKVHYAGSLVVAALIILTNSSFAQNDGQNTTPPTPTTTFTETIIYDEFRDLYPDLLTPPEPPVPSSPPPSTSSSPETGHDTNLVGEKGLIVTDNFPENYPNNRQYSWNITVPEGNRVKVTFHLLSVEYENSCNWDWVKVYDSDGKLRKFFCGYLRREFSLISSNETVRIEFRSDSVVQSSGFLASWEAIPEGFDHGNSSGIDDNSSSKGYILSFPQSLPKEGSDVPQENVCLELINVNDNGESFLKLYSHKSIVSDEPVVIKRIVRSGDQHNEQECFPLQLPESFEGNIAVLSINGSYGNYSFLAYKTVAVLKNSTLPLIQTDQYDYNTFQRDIKFRMMFLDAELKPSKATKVVKEVYVEDPLKRRVEQWRNVSLDYGIAQLSLHLDDEEPTLGKWAIHVLYGNDGDDEHKEVAYFLVSNNVPPKFEVSIEAPANLYKGIEEQNFKICATYTHGGKVRGQANVTFLVKYTEGYWRAPMRVLAISEDSLKLASGGCANVALNKTGIHQLAAKSMEIEVLAVVEERGTGIAHNTSHSVSLSQTPFRLDFAGSPQDHLVTAGKGNSFPYVGQVRALDLEYSIPLPDVKLRICARLFTDLEEVREYVNSHSHLFYTYTEDEFYKLGEKLLKLKAKESCDEFITDENGFVDFSVKLFETEANITKMSFRVEAVDFPANESLKTLQPTAKLDVFLTHVKYSSGLAIHDGKSNGKLKCNDLENVEDVNTINLYYYVPSNITIKLSWHFVSGGSIVDQGTDQVGVSEEDYSDEYVGHANILTFERDDEDYVEGEDLSLSKYTIDLRLPLTNGNQGRVSGKLKLIVNGISSDGNTFATHQTYEVATCSVRPKVAWSTVTAQPSSPVTFEIQGSPEAYCAYGVVDKSVTLVRNPNEVSWPKLLELKEDLANEKIINNQLRGPCKNGNKIFEAFEKVGLFVLSDLFLGETDCNGIVSVENGSSAVPLPAPPPFPMPIALQGAPLAASAQFGAVGPPAPAPPAPLLSANDVPSLAAEEQVAFSSEGPSFGFGGGMSFKNRVETLTDNSELHADEESGKRIKVNKSKVKLRNYFPETWMFDLAQLDSRGMQSLNLNAPHTITTWLGETACMDMEKGLTVSNTAELLVTQDFFVDLNFLHTVKRGEVFPFNVSVFNTVETDLPIEVTVLESEYYTVAEATDAVCVQEEDNTVTTFAVKADVLGEMNITVEAKISTKQGDSGCGANLDPESEGFTDVIRKPVLVKPEGFAVEEVQSEFLCKSADNEIVDITMTSLQLPEEDSLVEGSARAFFSVTGDVMAPALANLDSLVRLPTGCGEQNMMGLVPNIYLLKYLRAKAANAKKLETRAIRYMEIGYKKQQKYRFPDGSFSIWGPEQDKEGSLWLTAFVVKGFTQAAPYIKIDRNELKDSVRWISERQDNKTGCFKPTGYLIHEDLGGGDKVMTASILVTLLEVHDAGDVLDIGVDRRSIEKAFSCLVAEKEAEGDKLEDEGHYVQSLVTYASALYAKIFEPAETGENSGLRLKANDMVNNLILQANDSLPGKLFWTSGKGNLARDVEMSAYNVLSMVLQGKISESLKVVRWLATQRNAYGGFVSTQDTMIALQAIAEYSIRVHAEKNDLEIVATIGGEQGMQIEFVLTEDNELLLQQDKVETVEPDIPVHVVVKGSGCMLAQTVLRYNIKESPDKVAFDLTANQENDILEICASYLGHSKKSGMVVMEIELLSGFVPYLSSLDELKEAQNNDVDAVAVRKYEYNDEDGIVVLYFNHMPRSSNCYDVELKRKTKVEELKDAIIKIYDYYNPKDIVKVGYNLSV